MVNYRNRILCKCPLCKQTYYRQFEYIYIGKTKYFHKYCWECMTKGCKGYSPVQDIYTPTQALNKGSGMSEHINSLPKITETARRMI